MIIIEKSIPQKQLDQFKQNILELYQTPTLKMAAVNLQRVILSTVFCIWLNDHIFIIIFAQYLGH